ncbi:hypothetical protein NPIL_35171 [Nephila pilipes]|uniref:Uncharacterized protein n=1 Tax=Nephila pilipes TaxID=299642 RepID=A0A8X6NGZ7_NEPPI|nr:hypothetical protein NPIL_35171 [Nephila pilipes]
MWGKGLSVRTSQESPMDESKYRKHIALFINFGIDFLFLTTITVNVKNWSEDCRFVLWNIEDCEGVLAGIKMGLIRHYLRVFFRTHFQPIPEKTAKRGELYSSLTYFALAWTVFGFSVYYFIQKYDSKKSNFAAFSPYESMKKFGSEKESTLISIKGFKVEKEVLSIEEVEEKIKNN